MIVNNAIFWKEPYLWDNGPSKCIKMDQLLIQDMQIRFFSWLIKLYFTKRCRKYDTLVYITNNRYNGFNMLHTQNTIKDFSMTTLCIGPFKILCITDSDIVLIVLFHLFQRMLSQIYSCPFYTFNEKYS